MNKKIYLGFSSQANSKIVEDIKFAIDHEFNALCIELFWNPDVSFLDSEIKALKDYSSKGNKLIIHMPPFLPTNSSISEIAEGLLKYSERVIVFAKNIGASAITFHGGYVEQLAEKKNQNSLMINLKKIVSIAKEYGIRISIENDDKNSEYPLWQMKDVKEVLDKTADLTFTYDPGHANTADYDTLGFLKDIGHSIDILHLHNNFGKDSHNSLNDGKIDYKKVLPLITKDNPICILELFPHSRILENKKLFSEYLDRD